MSATRTRASECRSSSLWITTRYKSTKVVQGSGVIIKYYNRAELERILSPIHKGEEGRISHEQIVAKAGIYMFLVRWCLLRRKITLSLETEVISKIIKIQSKRRMIFRLIILF